MNLGKRPLSILVLSCLYIAIGIMGFAYHFPRPLAFHYEDVWIEGTELLAFVAGFCGSCLTALKIIAANQISLSGQHSPSSTLRGSGPTCRKIQCSCD